MKKTPAMLKTPSGYVQQASWLSVANKQLELMGRFMTELGMTPAARTRVTPLNEDAKNEPLTVIRLVGMGRDDEGNLIEHELPRKQEEAGTSRRDQVTCIDLDDRI